MRPTIDQSNAGGFLEGIGSIKDNTTEFFSNIGEFKDNTVDAIENIGEFCKAILKIFDWVTTVIFNPVIILTFIDKMAIVVIITLIVLKMLGFKDLQKWILLTILLKVIAMAFL